MTWKTYAEDMADKTRTVDGFKDFSLLGTKEKVSDILKMIGRVKGIFSTYTSHDITHVEAMLSMLDWLIPPETKSKLTSLEWLLLVLATYFHDLGMVVTTAEYDGRETNPNFQAFKASLEQDSESRDYLDRLQKIAINERDAFLYQEFVRANHAHRIREWITGDRTTTWGPDLQPIADDIASMLRGLPSRFKRNLADICESHHKETLEDRGYFPLCQRYGAPDALANTQYVALLLRTTDLLHITQDRTPSIMFRTLKISDPMGVDEWKKQMGTFSVQMKCRDFRPAETESHVVVVSADFDEERPFFVLTEYIAYANQQIEQTFRWAKKSQLEPDAEHYFFPWHRVEGDIRVQGNEPMPMRFELDRGRLLDLLVGHTIYNDPTVAIRELLQNAVDAVRYQHYLEKKAMPQPKVEPLIGQVQVKWNPAKRELVISDNGIGMDLDVIRYHLMTVGASFYDTPSFKADSADFIPISRFGIGILSCFMVSDNIEILTHKKGKGYRIRMSSVQADYLLKSLEKGDPNLGDLGEHGTKVTLILRPSVDLTKRTVLDIVRHWVVMPACNVLYEEVGSSVIQVGFSTPEEALRYFLFEQKGDDGTTLSSENIDIESRYISSDGPVYELAFAVRRTFTPDRNFVTNMPKGAPGTCLEGIRVDANLPGFHNIAAILSVRNNRAFRTTVSRDQLERDDEYVRIASVCAEMLSRYITDEVQRIQNAEGHPLSQASTASRWLYSSLLRCSNLKDTIKRLQKLHETLPQIVIESQQLDTVCKPSRELISNSQISTTPSFWTIEARVVDYLGVISRDLGRELSFTEFLSGIAPELHDPNINPLISDAHHYKYNILSTHEPEVARFSKRHQQTAAKWVLRSKPPMIIKALDNSEMNYLRPKIAILDEFVKYGYGNVFSFNTEVFSEIVESKIEGDISGIQAVRMRLGILLDPASSFAILWRKLMAAIITLQEGAIAPERGLLVAIASSVYSVFRDGRSDRAPWDPSGSSNSMLWKELVTNAETQIILERFDLTLPHDVRELQGDSAKWFDATRYWLDWNK